MSNAEKQENQRLQKQSESQKSEITSLTKDREKLQKDVGGLEAEIIELKEMVRNVPCLSYPFCVKGQRSAILRPDSIIDFSAI